jgi:hypothetical protein
MVLEVPLQVFINTVCRSVHIRHVVNKVLICEMIIGLGGIELEFVILILAWNKSI